jgi:3-hydroxybutyryl-CoA dehydratase
MRITPADRMPFARNFTRHIEIDGRHAHNRRITTDNQASVVPLAKSLRPALSNGLDDLSAKARMWLRRLCSSTEGVRVAARVLNTVLRRRSQFVTRHPWSIWSFDDLVVGDEWESPRRTVTETDVVLFAGLSGDFNPLHVDHSSAGGNPFGRPVAHGLLGLAIATGLMSQAPRVDTLAFLAILEWKFHRPIVFGDTIHALSIVVSLERQARGRRGIVTWHRKILNQDGHLVQEGRTQTLVRARSQPSAAP